jgi:hypothetical protein
VPADYFAKPKMPEPVPASPQSEHRKSQWPLLAGLAGVVAAVAIVAAIFAKSSQSGAQSEGRSNAPLTATPAAAPPSPAPQESLTLTRQVALAVVPQEAHVYDGEKDLGTSPVLLEVEEGKTLSLSVRMEGYKELALNVDGSQPRETAKLERLPSRNLGGARPAAKKLGADAKPEPKKKGSIGGGEIVNPWD